MKKVIIIILLVSFTTSFGQDKVETFWKEFQANEIEISKLPVKQKLDRLNKMIHKVSDKLIIKFSILDNKKTNMVITTDGNAKLFPLVNQIVDSSPENRVFTCTALRQTNPKHIGIKDIEKKLLVKGIASVSREADDELFIDFITSEEFTNIGKETMENLEMITVDDIIGEQLFPEEIVDFMSFFEGNYSMGLGAIRPLNELKKIIHKRKNKRKKRPIKRPIKLLATSGKWHIEYMKFKGQIKNVKKDMNWMIFYPDGKCEIVTDGKSANEKWNFKNNKLKITTGSKFHEFDIEKINNKKIIISSSTITDDGIAHIGLYKD